jgi:WD40 repeat protein
MTRWLAVALVAGVALGAVGQCQAQQPKLWATLTHEMPVSFVAFSPDGKMLASGSLDDTIKLWEVASARFRATFRGHKDMVTSVAFSPDGKMLASSSVDKTINCGNFPRSKGREGAVP